MSIATQVKGAEWFIGQTRGRESLSGPGSYLSATTEIRDWLPRVIRAYGVRSMADIPCGDWNWMQHVDLPVDYVGCDVVRGVIEQNRERYPHVRFWVLNAITDVPERVDLILCRDLLVHLSYKHGLQVLDNFRRSGSRWLLTTTFPGVTNAELPRWHDGWGWRPIDVESSPYGLDRPIGGVREVVAGERWERWVRIYAL